MEEELDYLGLFENVEKALHEEWDRHWEAETDILRAHGLTWSQWRGIMRLARKQMGGATQIRMNHGIVIQYGEDIGYIPFVPAKTTTRIPF